MNTCSRPNCAGEEVHRSGRCLKHYRKALAMTPQQFNVWVDDITLVLERIQNLKDNRWSFQKMADASGVSHTVIASIHRGAQKRCRKNTYDALLRIPPVHGVAVTRLGFKRRVQALAWMGYGAKEVAVELGLTEGAVRDAIGQGWFSPQTGEKLAAAYSRLSMIEGPNKRAMAFARGKRAYAPPAAWDDDTIDTAPELPGGTYLNQPDGRLRKQTHCGSGLHELKGDNLYVMPSGERRCRECRRKREREANKKYKQKTKSIKMGRKIVRPHCPYGHYQTLRKGEWRCLTCIRKSSKIA